jgi:outer membrane receptor protein involved in Fe transport
MPGKRHWLLKICLLMLLVYVQPAISGTTGKIAGRILDKETSFPLPGVNVVVEGTTMGAATGVDGYFTILHVPPGLYTVHISMMGYANVSVSDVRVRIDQTARVDVALEMETITGIEVTVVAEKSIIKEDVATSVAALSGDEVEALPLSTIGEVVGLQAGIENGLEIRGGGAEEALFQVDGITLRDPRNNQPISGIALSAIKEISVERGGFNAEYGQVRSGIVNIVTKEGSKTNYHGTVTLKYSPPAAKHFGISPYDANSMWCRPYLDPTVCWTGTEDGEWDEYTARQYPEFRGWNKVSEELLTNSDPSDDLSPLAAQRLFMWEHRKRPVTNQPDYNIDAGFGGPVPFISKELGNLRFFTSYRSERQMLLVPLARDDYLDYDWTLNMTSDINQSMKLKVSGLYGKSYNIAINDGDERYYGTEFGPSSTQYWSPTQYIRTPLQIAKITDEQRPGRIFSDSWYCPAEIRHYSFAAKLTHTLNPTTFYEASIEHVARQYETGPVEARDVKKQYEILPNFFVDEAPFGFSTVPEGGIGGAIRFFGGHTAEARDSSKISATTVKFDLTSQLNFTNLLKTGFEFIYNDLGLNYGQVNYFTGKEIFVNMRSLPYRGAFYVQDKLEAKGFILNIGLRMDFSNSNTAWASVDPFDKSYFSAKYDPNTSYSMQDAKTQVTFSPRLAISHPITENSKLFFNYGHFQQLPTYEQILRLGRDAGGGMQNFGDPNLDLAKTVSYELGYDHLLFNSLLLQAAAFYHDIKDQQGFTAYASADGSVTYTAANNNSYEDIRGLELTLRKSAGQWWSGFANYTYQVNTFGYFGKQRIFENPSEQRVYDENTRNLYQGKPIPQPYARASLEFHTPGDFGPKFLGFKFLKDWAVNLLYYWRAGEYIDWNPYDKLDVYDNVQVKDYHNSILRLSKTFSLSKMKFTFFAEIDNLFNMKRLSGASFYDGFDWEYYMQSLHLPASQDYDNIVGDDRAGEYRESDIPFQPIEQVGMVSDILTPNPDVIYYGKLSEDDAKSLYYNYINDEWSEVDKGHMEKVLDDKAYIDMPNQTSFNFLNPRQIFFGIKMSFDLD